MNPFFPVYSSIFGLSSSRFSPKLGVFSAGEDGSEPLRTNYHVCLGKVGLRVATAQ